ncbi:MAG: MoxR family ATPase [Planctomycetota bacterium]|nr:MoxR family ATPase [Planctomycetota bacterium]
MTPNELETYLQRLVEHELKLSAMIWGPPGIGKSSIVQQIADSQDLGFIDLRLSQLAPTDLRGLPVPKQEQSAWLPPEFLPTDGRGILFLDEINMAPPAMQGVSQQLILDRRVGSYCLPEGWFVWSAGNRKEDRAAVFDMPSPLANRFIHLEVEPSAEDFRQYAYAGEFDDRLIAFVAFREDLLHKLLEGENAWPSPRSWEMADKLHKADLDIAAAVGLAPAAEFYAYLDVIEKIPNLDQVMKGKFNVGFPDEPSLRYATIMGLVGRCKQPDHAINGFHWLVEKAPAEWIQLFATDLFPILRKREQLAEVHGALTSEPKLQKFLNDFTSLLAA